MAEADGSRHRSLMQKLNYFMRLGKSSLPPAGQEFKVSNLDRESN